MSWQKDGTLTLRLTTETARLLRVAISKSRAEDYSSPEEVVWVLGILDLLTPPGLDPIGCDLCRVLTSRKVWGRRLPCARLVGHKGKHRSDA